MGWMGEWVGGWMGGWKYVRTYLSGMTSMMKWSPTKVIYCINIGSVRRIKINMPGRCIGE